MAGKLTSKLLLIVFVLGLCGLSMWPPREKLNLGIDLRGGTSLLYEVDLTGVDNPQETLEQTIRVLQRRVDPEGVRNLNWRVEAGNRIEIQMPLAGEQVLQRRHEYRRQLERIEQSAISRTEVLAALRADPEQRDGALRNLAREVEGRHDLLQEAAIAYDKLREAQAALEQTEQGSDAYIEQAGRVAEAEIALDRAVDAVMATNLDPAELGRILEMPTVRQRDEAGRNIEGSSPRERALDRLKTQHPQRAAQIEQVVAAYDAYQQVKGPLDDPNDLVRLLRGAGVLEFRITVQPGELADIDAFRRRLAERGPQARLDAAAGWFVLDDPLAFFDLTAEQLDDYRSRLDQAGDQPQRNAVLNELFGGRGLIGAYYGGDFYILLWDTPDKALTERQSGWELSSAGRGIDDLGRPAVNFTMNAVGASYLGQLTGDHVNRQMAIVLDGRVYSAPVIQSQIRSQGQITGRFSQREISYLIQTLGAGALKARLSEEPISVRNVGPSLGHDNLQRGLRSALWALIVVAAFIMVYYFLAGAVADLALMANLVIILGVLSLVQATFTLPGIAGVVLTIGMAVDANVLIFERIREELARGAEMPTALRLGYEKAFSSIIDANLTNLIICFVLGYTATADVKGFAVVLGIGICATLFTALFMTRVIYDLYYRALGGRRKLQMLPIALPAVDRLLSPSIDWIGKRALFFCLSAVVLVGSLVFCYARGRDMLDIEFRAGTEVAFSLQEGRTLTLEEARSRLTDTALAEGGNTYNVVTVGPLQEGGAAQFAIVTTEPDAERVADAVRTAFADVIDIQPVIRFEGQEAQQLAEAPLYPVTEADLGRVINRPDLPGVRVPEFVGGVAIVLRDIAPPQTLDQLEQRIDTMRFQPDFENVQYRKSRVIGLTPDPDRPGSYTDAVFVSVDPAAAYFDDPQRWESSLAATEWRLVRDGLGRETSFSKVSNFNPTVARTMTYNAIAALGLSIIAIVAYIWFRFGSLRYGLAAIAALVHDLIVTLGLVAVSAYLYDTFLGGALMLEPFKINMPLIAALLTIIGYSLNDTIVLFDRIRENRGKLAVASPAIINDSINQVISRTVLTSSTTFLAVLCMYVFGGEGIHNFAFALVAGVIVGTYSSIGIASPLLLVGTKYARAPSPAALDAAARPSASR